MDQRRHNQPASQTVLQEQRGHDQLQVLYQVTDAVNRAEDLESIYEQALQGLRQGIAASKAAILLLDDQQTMRFVAWHGLSDSYRAATEGHSPWESTTENPQPVLVPDVNQEPSLAGLRATILREGIQSLGFIPLVDRGRLLGKLMIYYEEPHEFTFNELQLAKTLAHQIAFAIRQKRDELVLRRSYDELEVRMEERLALLKEQIARRKKSEAQLAQRARRLATLTEMAQAVTSTLDLELVFERVLQELLSLLGAEGVFILLLEGDELVFAATSEVGAGDLTGRRAPAGSGVAGEVLRTGRSQHFSGEKARRRVYPVITVTGYQTGAILAVPLRLHGRLIGVMETIHNRPDGFDEEDLKLLEAAAAWTAIAIENARLFARVQMDRKRLRQLTRQVVLAQEQERQRISRELHDDAGQALTALKINLGLLRSSLPEEMEPVRQQLAEAVKLTEQTMDQIRLLAQDLRPPVLDSFGLDPSLEGLCRDFARHTQLAIHYQGADVSPLGDAVTISLYRFAQEALTNVAKHARATQVDVVLKHNPGMIVLSVTDDGQGFKRREEEPFSRPAGGIGLIGMQERIELLGGRVAIDSEPGRGTHVVAYVPIGPEEEAVEKL
ncbi:MAG: GAF domain-containing sensor histidine kinase [Chloroflexi bacterium]|nr:GAF domain-containing sensor histidine kinase [Chloroflexota bacterium]